MRLIDADALKKSISEWLWCETEQRELVAVDDIAVSVIMEIEDQPTVPDIRVGEWIPVSERLPEVDEYVLISLSYGNVEWGWITATGRWVMEHFTLDDGEVLAWMPLPEPYKVGEDE